MTYARQALAGTWTTARSSTEVRWLPAGAVVRVIYGLPGLPVASRAAAAQAVLSATRVVWSATQAEPVMAGSRGFRDGWDAQGRLGLDFPIKKPMPLQNVFARTASVQRQNPVQRYGSTLQRGTVEYPDELLPNAPAAAALNVTNVSAISIARPTFFTSGRIALIGGVAVVLVGGLLLLRRHK